jgi:hypothetical protein
MKSSALIALVNAIALAFLARPANAQASLSWVSGLGNDANPCTRTAPCKTFAGTISKTAAGGTINCLDPGGFGALTITKSITIDCEKVFGSVLVSGTNGMTIAAGSGGVVNLRGLRFDGLIGNGGNSGTTGINVTQAAAVYIEKSVIFGFQTDGINFTGGGTLVVNDTAVYSNGTGIVLNGGGSTINATLRDVIVHDNSGAGVSITSGGATIDHSTLAYNATGLNVNGSSVTALIGNSTITGNTTGVSVSSGTLYSFKENQIAGNITDGTPITAFPGGPQQ